MSRSPTVAILPRPTRGPAPCSSAQRRLWFLQQLAPASAAAYNVAAAFRVTGEVDLAALGTALTGITDRHEALRTRIVDVRGEPQQVVLPRVEPRIAIDPFDPFDPATGDREERLRSLLGSALGHPFDPAETPLFRVLLVRTGPAECVLGFAFSHLVCDAWSLGLFLDELDQRYAAAAGRVPFELAPLSVQYADFAVWERERRHDPTFAEELDRWAAEYADAPLTVPSPDLLRPPIRRFRGRRRPVPLPAGLAATVRAASRAAGATGPAHYLAAFQVLLARWTGQDDVVVGMPVAGRPRTELEPVIGFFASTAPLRVQLPAGMAGGQAVRTAAAAIQRALTRAHLPFEELVELLQPERDMQRSPVFQCFYAYQNAPDRGLRLEGLAVERFPVQFDTAKFDLELEIFETAAGSQAVLEYNTDIFLESTIDRFATHYLAVVESLAVDPDRAATAIELAGPSERAELRAATRGTVIDFSGGTTLGALIAQQATRTPDATAVVGPEGALTYRALWARARGLARLLTARGAGPDSVVAVCLDRSTELVVALVGILAAGAAYLPIDPDHPRERILAQLVDAGVGVVVTSPAVAARLALDGGPDVLAVDGTEPPAAPDAQPEPPGPGPDNLAYVIYTSGSTGVPKGVMVSHRAIVNRLRWMQDEYRLTGDDRLLQKTPYTFDVSVWEFFWPLCTGAQLVVAPPGVHRDPAALAAVLARHAVTVTHFVPTMLAEFLAADPPPLPGLRMVFCSGEALPADLARRQRERFPARLHNLYGPTEAAVDVTYHDCAVRPWRATVPIGRPVANTAAYVLDRDMRQVPIGVPGELYLGGVQLARGYLRRPALTASRFVADPSGAPGGRLYRTGDVARWLDTGELEFLGRADNQVKLRGQRIELGEVEVALRRHPEIGNAVAAVREWEGRDVLVAYLVLGGSLPASAATESADESAIVRDWQQVWDERYGCEVPPGDPATECPGADYRGWVSSYTGAAIPVEEMREFVSGTVRRIRALGGDRLLEVGAGSGLLLHRLARECTEYWATDLSAAVVDRLAAEVSRVPDLAGKVHLEHREAADLHGLPAGYFDGVILNSVVQYLPSRRHLKRVLRAAVDRVRDGGYVFVGDVRNLRLLRLFHAAVQAWRAPTGLPAAELAVRLGAAQAGERELLIDPAFFAEFAGSVPGITVGHALRAGRARNEMTEFRYDVVLRRVEAAPDLAVEEHTWPAELSTVFTATVRDPEKPRLVRGVPNARLAVANAVLAGLDAAGPSDPTVDELLARAAGAAARAVDPHDLVQEAERHGLTVAIGWSGTDTTPPGAMDVLVRPAGGADEWLLPGTPGTPAGTALTSDPGTANRHVRVEREVRAMLARWLPQSMIPQLFCILPALPAGASGKVDRRRLPPPGPRRGPTDGYLPPRTDDERIVAEVWGDLLGVDRVGARDNFFAVGGDSILAIQVVTRLRERGLGVPLRAFFENPTVERIAGTAERLAATQPNAALRVALTRVQADLLSLGDDRQPALLRSLDRPRASRVRWERALRSLVRDQPALRLRFTADTAGGQYLTDEPTGATLRWLEHPGGPDAAAGSGVDAVRGAGVRLTVIDRPGATQDLYLAVDRLLVDGDLLVRLGHALDRAVDAPVAVDGPDRAQAMIAWLSAIASRQGPSDAARGLPRGPGRRATAGLTGEPGARLVRLVTRRYRCTVADLLVAALDALGPGPGGGVVADVQFSGPAADPDLAGPFDRRVRVALGSGDSRIDSLRSAKRQLRAAPAGTGSAPTGAPTVLLRLRDVRAPGEVPGGEQRLPGELRLSGGEVGRPGGEVRPPPAGPTHWDRVDDESADAVPAAYQMMIVATVTDAGVDLRAACRAGANGDVDPAALLERYLDVVRRLADEVLDGSWDLYLPADFPAADVPEPALAELARRHPDLADLYPLTPMQCQAVTRLDRQPVDGLYAISVTFAVTGKGFDVDAFRATWRRLMHRHTALRTFFIRVPGAGWRQAVHADPPVPIGTEDLRAASPDRRAARLAELQRAARDHRFRLSECPQWKMDILRFGADDYRIVCRLSYALQDGWSFSVLQEEWFVLYREAVAGRAAPLDPAPRLRDHLTWIAQQDMVAAEAFWRTALRGLADAGQVLTVPPDRRLRTTGQPGELAYQSRQIRLGRLLEQRLRAVARAHHVTVFTLLEAGWARTLARFTGRSRVAFGTVSAGRSPDVPGYDRIFGALNSILPVVVDVPVTADPVPWLRHLQYEHTVIRRYDFASVADMAGWLGRVPGDPLVDNFLVFENFPRQAGVDSRLREWGPDSGETQTEHALRLLIWPTAPLTVFASFYRDRLDGTTVDGLLAGLVDSLGELTAATGGPRR